MPDKHDRHSIRLKEYDYALPGAYFVTICTRDRACLFGHVMNGEMHLNEAGEIVRKQWFNTTATFAPRPTRSHQPGFRPPRVSRSGRPESI